MKQRISIIDALKGIAIIAVALYHYGGRYLPYGYLGVDIFFVVGGYLLISSLKRQMEKGVFNYWKFLFRKIVRLWPLVILVSVVAVGIGFFLMLPDDYENLAESVIASSAFVNNILQCITTKNYWDVVNLYKPLMHLWYIGVLMQAYIVLPLIYMLLSKVNRKRGIAIGTASITIVSFILFLLPTFSSA
jgi:peptidoglycan/LPS O-acetylase OafA/YrhL